MEKLTLSIQNKEKIAQIKAFAKAHQTSVSRLFESYIESLLAFDRAEVKLSDTLQSLKQPGKRPDYKQIDRHLTQRRQRSSTENQG